MQISEVLLQKIIFNLIFLLFLNFITSEILNLDKIIV